MENRDNQGPDVSKSQQAQQPRETQRQPEMDQQNSSATGQSEPSGSFETQQSGQADYGSAGLTETLATRGEGESADVEGSAATGERDDAFVGTEGFSDTSSELIEDEGSDFARDGQGATE